MKGVKGAVLCGGLVLVAGIVGLVLWRTLRARSNSSPANANTSLPIDRLRAFPLTNGLTGVASASWSTNQPIEPLKALVMRQVAAAVRVNQPSNAPSSVVEIAGNFRDSKQGESLRRLQERVGSSLQVYLRTENNTPNQLKGSPLAKAVSGGEDPNSRNETTAKAFFRDNAELFLIHNPDSELQLANRQADDLGGSTLRFTQHYRGLTVWPAEIGVHLDTSGNVDLVDGAYVPTPNDVAIQPKLAAKDSEVKARSAVSGGANAAVQTPELVIYGPLDQPAKLAWKMEVSVALDQAWWAVIDAQNGDTLTMISRVMNDSVSGSGADLLGVSRPLNVWRSGATFYMIDASKPMFNAVTGYGFIETDDAINQSQSQILSNSVLQNMYFVTSASSSLWVNSDAVSAAYNLSQTYDYYFDRFNRNSYNGSGSNIFAVVRIGGLLNAFWHDGFKRMFFGSADQFAASLDVIGHEVTHGVTFSIGSQGVLFYQDQSGALNEAFADVFGEMIEARTKGTNDWLLGSQLVGENLHRSMSNPSAYNQPATMSQYVVTASDHGGVHVNSGIINRAYYLLAAGLKGAVGNCDAERIFYRCLTVSMKPSSQFIDARLGCIAAAEALFGVGSQQALKTAEAFNAVELYAAPASAPQPTNVNAAVSAPDSAMFIRSEQYWDWGTLSWRYRTNLCRIETAQGDSSSGSSMVTSVKLARPAISGNGAEMFFVGGDESLYAMQTTGTGFTNLNLAGLVHSLAVSPQGHYVAFVFNAAPGIPTNQIVIHDLWSNVTSTVNLVTPVSDGPPLNNVSYADALSFSPDGKLLIYDALSRLRGADGQMREAWSIFGLDMATLQQQVVIPTDDQFDIGNPCFSRTSSRYVVFDAQYTNGNTAVITLDLYRGTLGVIGVSYNAVGYPVFNGDDSKVFFADEDLSTSSGRSIYVQQLSADRLGTNGNRAMAIRDAKLAVIYRRGTFASVNTAPSVTLTSPAPNAVFTAPTTVTVAASANDIDGSVSRVEFYSGDKLLLTDTASPFNVALSNLPAGVYAVFARVYDNQGASATSAPLRFTVKPSNQAGVMNRVGTPGFEFALSLAQPGLYRLEASTNLADWVSLGSFYCSTNLGYLDASATNLPRRFYRAVSTP